MGEDVRIPAQPSPMDAYFARPAGESAGSILILHARYGLELGYKDLAERFAAEGYAGLAMNWQTREQEPSTAASLADIAAARRFLEEQAGGPLGLAGFCRGGSLVQWALVRDSKWRAGVALYSLPKHNTPKDPGDLSLWSEPRPAGSLLMLHGAEDVPAPIEEIVEYARKLSKDGAHYELKIYSDVGHRFFLPTDQGYKEAQSRDCWTEMVEFFGRNLAAAAQ